ncbi:MAG: glycosyltransferase family 2 protein [Prevotella sp.]|jgi:glycosyltransferase involved in cell wall biosynthesis|nr:glycosyltransferase family 2 protein [Prevotella sp.]
MAYEVTIGIPVYNVEKYIRRTIDSALAQTFPSIEFIICDDCGTDSSIDIVREYQQTHPRGKDIRIVRQPRNMGIGEGRNRMMAEAQGRYFFSLDADDVITPNAIELLYEAAQKYQAELVYGSHERLFVNGENQRTVQYPYPFRVFTEQDEYANYAYSVGVQVMNWNYLIELDIIRRNKLRVTPVGHGYGEDFTYTVDLPTYVTRVVLLPDVTYQYFIEEKVFTGKRIKVMSRQQMDCSIQAIDTKKRRSELKGRPYYARRCATLMMYDFSFACQIVRRSRETEPPYTNEEIRSVMWCPMSFWQIMRAKAVSKKLLFYWLWGALPASLSVSLMRLLIKCGKT